MRHLDDLQQVAVYMIRLTLVVLAVICAYVSGHESVKGCDVVRCVCHGTGPVPRVHIEWPSAHIYIYIYMPRIYSVFCEQLLGCLQQTTIAWTLGLKIMLPHHVTE